MNRLAATAGGGVTGPNNLTTPTGRASRRAPRGRLGEVRHFAVTGYALSYTAFEAKAMDASGIGTGDAFTVYALTTPSGSDVRECTPYFAPGDRIRAQMQTFFLGSEWLTAWVATDTLSLTEECEA